WIESVEAIPLVYSSYVPDDLDSVAHYHLPLIHAPEAWDIGRGDSQVVVAIVDNGVLISHEALADVIWQNPYEIPNNQIDDDGNGYVDDVQGWDIADADNDPSPPNRAFKHGSHVAGCVGATTDNGKGVAAIGFGCHLMPIKLASDRGFADAYPFSDALKGIEYAIINGADIINMSFGGTENLVAGQALIDPGHARGIIFVAAAGNGPADGNPNTNDTTLEYPASWRHVISVCGTDQSDLKASFATANTLVDVCAPGEQIRSTFPSVSLNSAYGQQRGSSQSTAIVSGLLALMLSKNPCLTPDEAERILKAGCTNIDALNPTYAGKLGAGRIDAQASMNLLLQQVAPVADFSVLDSQTCTGRVQFLYNPNMSQKSPDSFFWSCTCGQQSSLD
ncbi:MAG: S8 family serine peptidase, partial [Methylococcales bacterium]|nr:S8 family serine peptidase [Methylococcales bacterium]